MCVCVAAYLSRLCCLIHDGYLPSASRRLTTGRLFDSCKKNETLQAEVIDHMGTETKSWDVPWTEVVGPDYALSYGHSDEPVFGVESFQSID